MQVSRANASLTTVFLLGVCMQTIEQSEPFRVEPRPPVPGVVLLASGRTWSGFLPMSSWDKARMRLPSGVSSDLGKGTTEDGNKKTGARKDTFCFTSQPI